MIHPMKIAKCRINLIVRDIEPTVTNVNGLGHRDRQRSRRVRSGQPDRLSVIGQENVSLQLRDGRALADSIRYETFIIFARDSSYKYTPQGVNCRTFYANVH